MKKGNSSSNSILSEGFVSDQLPVLFFALILSYLIYGISMKQLPDELSDLNGHVYVYIATFTGVSPVEGWKMAPYFLWHAFVLLFNKVLNIPVDVSASVTCSLFALGSYFASVFMIRRWCEFSDRKMSHVLCGFLAFTLTVLQPVWIEYLDAGSARGIGTFSMNPLFNPTHMAARPFALCCFMLVIDLFRLHDGKETIFFRGNLRRISILLAVFLFLSAMAKPVFAEMFIPAVGLMMLAGLFCRIRQKDGSAVSYLTKVLLPAFLIAVPCLLCILVQFLAYFLFGGSYGGGEGIVITGWLEVWSFFTENIPLSVLLGMSFPILVIVTDARNFLKTGTGQLGLTSYIVGFLECALLGEGGDKLSHGDFIWPMLFGMLMLWAAALLHFLEMEKRAAGTSSRIIMIIGWILILIHLHYGFLYISEALGWNFFLL
ncbi:MAG: hypothetical protein K5871_04585 [Lachnospiraceae bacterium]|nr:hypothetical protein [Lachnospiraceae bacterium]